MRNMTVSTAGGALSEAPPLSRRSVFGGIAAAPALALPALAAQQPASQKEIAKRVRDLAGEMSKLLASLDGGGWKVEVKPALAGVWQYELERTDLDVTVRLQQALTVVSATGSPKDRLKLLVAEIGKALGDTAELEGGLWQLVLFGNASEVTHKQVSRIRRI